LVVSCLQTLQHTLATLQHTCNTLHTLQHTCAVSGCKLPANTTIHLQHCITFATHLQHTAKHMCFTWLQVAFKHCNTLSTLQHACSTLQHMCAVPGCKLPSNTATHVQYCNQSATHRNIRVHYTATHVQHCNKSATHRNIRVP